jgi:hypothetical protein
VAHTGMARGNGVCRQRKKGRDGRGKLAFFFVFDGMHSNWIL